MSNVSFCVLLIVGVFPFVFNNNITSSDEQFEYKDLVFATVSFPRIFDIKNDIINFYNHKDDSASHTHVYFILL